MKTPRSLCAVVVAASTLLSATAGQPASPLAGQPSAFLQQHAAGPVHWMPWGEAAFARAKTEQKPLFVAVGSFTSELSRAMNRQTFSNAETAATLNENFVCVLVDAKEDRDVVALYQNYLAGKQLTGLPMNLFLTPEGKPFEGATYLPPTEEWGKEGFGTVLKRTLAGWKTDAAAQRAKAGEAVNAVIAAQHEPSPTAVNAAAARTLLVEATEAWKARFDRANGGFGDAPKYIEPELLRFLLRETATRDLAVTTLRAVIHGAARDPLDGGFFRYVLDAEWRLPYFQKSLVDQPRVALALLEAAKLTNETAFAEAARSALNYAVHQLRGTAKDSCAAEDATAETLLASYLWTLDEIKTALGTKDAEAFSAAHGVTAEGNLAADAFPNVPAAGKNLLRRVTPRGDDAAEKALASSATKLLEQRKQRPAPLRDNAAPSGTHGLLLAALAQAGAQLNDVQFAAAAKSEYELLRNQFIGKDGALRHLVGSSVIATPDDYAGVIAGLTTYASTNNDREAAALATALTSELTKRFWDESTARFFATGPENEAAGIWARVHSAAPGVGEPPGAEATLLLALSETAKPDKAGHDLKSSLARSVAANIKDAGEVARGDLLLALQAFEQTRGE